MKNNYRKSQQNQEVYLTNFFTEHNNINMMQEKQRGGKRHIKSSQQTGLPRYYRYLGELMEDGVERISSNELRERMKVTASPDQDLNNLVDSIAGIRI